MAIFLGISLLCDTVIYQIYYLWIDPGCAEYYRTQKMKILLFKLGWKTRSVWEWHAMPQDIPQDWSNPRFNHTHSKRPSVNLPLLTQPYYTILQTTGKPSRQKLILSIILQGRGGSMRNKLSWGTWMWECLLVGWGEAQTHSSIVRAWCHLFHLVVGFAWRSTRSHTGQRGWGNDQKCITLNMKSLM